MSRDGLRMNASVSLAAAQVNVCQYGLLVLRGCRDLMTGVQGFLFLFAWSGYAMASRSVQCILILTLL